MNEENKNKAKYVTVDISTSVKPIAISEEEALKKAKADNETQAQFKDDDIETVETNIDETMKREEEAAATYKSPEAEEVTKAMEEANKQIDKDAFHEQNDLLQQTTDKKKMSKDVAIILAIIVAILLILLIVEIPSFISTFS